MAQNLIKFLPFDIYHKINLLNLYEFNFEKHKSTFNLVMKDLVYNYWSKWIFIYKDLDDTSSGFPDYNYNWNYYIIKYKNIKEEDIVFDDIKYNHRIQYNKKSLKKFEYLNQIDFWPEL